MSHKFKTTKYPAMTCEYKLRLCHAINYSRFSIKLGIAKGKQMFLYIFLKEPQQFSEPFRIALQFRLYVNTIPMRYSTRASTRACANLIYWGKISRKFGDSNVIVYCRIIPRFVIYEYCVTRSTSFAPENQMRAE